mmetsp:Transcript_29624/g.71141  ORF Transcript_29624/g.71141 Transcript_29624/m.71141 type:complete len:256 (+) Transcript_29624:861-1628(+)
MNRNTMRKVQGFGTSDRTRPPKRALSTALTAAGPNPSKTNSLSTTDSGTKLCASLTQTIFTVPHTVFATTSGTSKSPSSNTSKTPPTVEAMAHTWASYWSGAPEGTHNTTSAGASMLSTPHCVSQPGNNRHAGRYLTIAWHKLAKKFSRASTADGSDGSSSSKQRSNAAAFSKSVSLGGAVENGGLIPCRHSGTASATRAATVPKTSCMCKASLCSSSKPGPRNLNAIPSDARRRASFKSVIEGRLSINPCLTFT